MVRKRIIIDNSVLSLIPSFKSFKFYNQVKLLFSEILIPQEIKLEFAMGTDFFPERQKILDTIRISNSFYVFAMLDLQEFLPDRKECFKEYYSLRKFDTKKLRTAYEQAYSYLGIKYTKEQLSQKYSFKKLGLR